MILRKYNSIDLMKIIMSICVVAIHTEPLNNCTNKWALNIFDSVVRMAVPFFFVVSGFLLASKFDDDFSSDHNIDIVKKTLIRIMKLYVLWTIIYLPMTMVHFLLEKKSILHNFVDFIRGFIFIGQQYNSWPLWYLLSTIYSLCLILLILKLKLNRKILLTIGFVFLIFSTGVSWFVSYTGTMPYSLTLVQKALSYTIVTGRIFTGAFYIPLGIYLQKKEMPVSICTTMLVLGFILSIFTTSFVIDIVLLVVSITGLFGVVVKWQLKDNSIYPILRRMSTVIYFVHMYVWTGYYMIVYQTKTYGFDSFVITVVVSVLIAMSYCWIKMKLHQEYQ